MLEKEEYNMGTNKKRHGSVLNITMEEYNNLINTWAL